MIPTLMIQFALKELWSTEAFKHTVPISTLCLRLGWRFSFKQTNKHYSIANDQTMTLSSPLLLPGRRF